MPLTAKGEKILSAMTAPSSEGGYGEEKGKQVFYAAVNKGIITGVHDGVAIESGGTGFYEKDVPILKPDPKLDQGGGGALEEVQRFAAAVDSLAARFDDYVGSVGALEGGHNVRVRKEP